ncbi:MAG: LysR substrate-binding domain-containing protein [Sandaracinus sp.]
MKRKNVRRLSRAVFDELGAAEVLLQVIATRGFTAAARVLGRSTSSLSRTIAELERQVGAQLLARTTRRVSLTEAGQLYASHAERLLAARRSARDAVTELTGGIPRGRLRVTMPVSVGEQLVGPWISELRRRYPELQLELDLSDRNQPLVSGGFDLAIRVGRQPDSSLRVRGLGRVPVKLVASPAYVAEHGDPAAPLALRDHACITVAQTAGPMEWTFHHRRARGRTETVEVEGVVHTTSARLGASLAVAGQGVLRIDAWTIREALATGALVEVMSGWSCTRNAEGGLPIHVVYAQTAGVEPPLKSRVFVDLLREELESSPFARELGA